MPFRALHLSPQILQAVRDSGYTEPTPIQIAAIPLILVGNDVIGIAQTGTGKTAAYVLPILMKLAESKQTVARQGDLPVNRRDPKHNVHRLRALVLAPTRELVVQIEENVRAYAKHVPLRVATVFGGVSERPQIEALRSGVDMVVATPGRLIDLMEQRAANLSEVEFVVLDEADRMLDMGFLPPIRRIMKALPQKRQTLMFSASLSREIEALTHQFQQSPKMVEIGRRANPVEAVTQLVYEVPPHLKPALLLHLLRDPDFDTVLVFSRTERGADRIRTAGEQRNQNRHNPFQSFPKSAVARLKRLQVRRGASAGGYGHCGARYRCGWDLACGELRFPDALRGLCPSHRTRAPVTRTPSVMRSALLRRKIMGRCVRSSVSSAVGSYGKRRKLSITINLRRHATSGAAEREARRENLSGE